MRLLDLFCGAGGAAMGYHQAGFDEIVGVDISREVVGSASRRTATSIAETGGGGGETAAVLAGHGRVEETS